MEARLEEALCKDYVPDQCKGLLPCDRSLTEVDDMNTSGDFTATPLSPLGTGNIENVPIISYISPRYVCILCYVQIY